MRSGPPQRCAMCRYNLRGLPRRGRCPECGSTYDFTSSERRHAASQARLRHRLDCFDRIAVALMLVILTVLAALTLLM